MKNDKGTELISNILDKVAIFKEKGLADPHFEKELCSNEEQKFYQRLFELNLAFCLLEHGFDIESNDEGPDFKFKISDQTFWIEAVSPPPQNLPRPWLDDVKDGKVRVWNHPGDQLTLRVTSVLKTKREKFLSYISNGIVSREDICIIAIDCGQICVLGGAGISGFPTIVEAVYPVGPLQVHFHIDDTEITKTDYAYKPVIIKKTDSKAPVRTDSFLSPEFVHISGAMSCRSSLTGIDNICIVHNFMATAPFQNFLLPANKEYVPLENSEMITLENIIKNSN
jgi:hypothetical protein